MTDVANIVRREAEFLLYAAPDGAVKVRVLFRDETAWLTKKALAELFAVKVPVINKHLTNIFESEELSRSATVSKMEIVQRVIPLPPPVKSTQNCILAWWVPVVDESC